MELRPCIDIHNGKVKQIVGASLRDEGDAAKENYVSERDAAYFADLFDSYGLRGGHAILLNGKDSPYYEATKAQAVKAISQVPGFLQVGGGISADNAADYIKAGASHVIVTSALFSGGRFCQRNLDALVQTVGEEHICIDLSCRKKEDGKYYVVTDRWQHFTELEVTAKLLWELGAYCDEYLIHGVDVEGTRQGVDEDLLTILAQYEGNPVTYAGGVRAFSDIDLIQKVGCGRINVTVGSALEIFGGDMKIEDIINRIKENC